MRTIQGRDQHIWIGGDFGLVFSNGSGFQKNHSIGFVNIRFCLRNPGDLRRKLVVGRESRRSPYQWRPSAKEAKQFCSSRGILTSSTLSMAFLGHFKILYEVEEKFRRAMAGSGLSQRTAWPGSILQRLLRNYLPPPVSIRSVEANGERYDPRGRWHYRP